MPKISKKPAVKKGVKQLTSVLTMERTRRMIGNSRVIRKFADANNMVYFGSVDGGDEARLVKGLTLSRTARDTHYCVGSRFGRDLMFVQRSDTLRGANKKRQEHYTWNILQIDLRPGILLPHMFLNGRGRYDTVFMSDLSMKKRDFFAVQEHTMQGYDPLFIRRYEPFLESIYVPYFPFLVPPESAAVIAHHFYQMDFECVGDELLIYLLAKQPTRNQLDLLVKAGVWLAAELEKGYERAVSTAN